MASDLASITGIDYDVFRRGFHHKDFTVAEKMSCISRRETSRIEDMSYSILGLFDINMSLLYREGSNAFLRLRQEIVRKTDDMPIFAWETREITDPVRIYSMFAPGPEFFSRSSRIIRYIDQVKCVYYETRQAYGNALEFLSQTPYVVTNKGLQVSGYCCSTSVRELGLPLPHLSAASSRDRLLVLACGIDGGGHVSGGKDDFRLVAVPITLRAPMVDRHSSIQNDGPRSGYRYGNIIFLDSQKVFDSLATLEKLDFYLDI